MTLEAYANATEEVRRNAAHILGRALRAGIHTSLDHVIRHYDDYVRWDEGREKVGYLYRRTGARPMTIAEWEKYRKGQWDNE